MDDHEYIEWTFLLRFMLSKILVTLSSNLMRRGTYLLAFHKNMRGTQSMYLFNAYPFILLESVSFYITSMWDMENT